MEKHGTQTRVPAIFQLGILTQYSVSKNSKYPEIFLGKRNML